jgi:hypothetical protein
MSPMCGAAIFFAGRDTGADAGSPVRNFSSSPSRFTDSGAIAAGCSSVDTTVSPGRPSTSSAAAVCDEAMAMRTGAPAVERRICSPISRALPKRRERPERSSITSGPIVVKRGVKSCATFTKSD